MNRLIYSLIIFATALTLGSCSPKLQILHTMPASDNIKQSGDVYFFENDTLKIIYAFWEKQGIMGFTIENKLNIPLYIDWRKSALICDGIKSEYYREVTTMTASSEYKSAGYSGGMATTNGYGTTGGGAYSVGAGRSNTTAVSVKEERISFIPPHSRTAKATYELLPGKYINLSSIQKTELPNGVKAKVEEANRDNSELNFGNFLTYSTKENFEGESYVSNNFYVSKVVQLPYRFLDREQAPNRFYITYTPNY